MTSSRLVRRPAAARPEAAFFLAAILAACLALLLATGAPAKAPQRADVAADVAAIDRALGGREARLWGGDLELVPGEEALPGRAGFDRGRAAITARITLGEGAIVALTVRWPASAAAPAPRVVVSAAGADDAADGVAASASLLGEAVPVEGGARWRTGGYLPAGTYRVVVSGAKGDLAGGGSELLRDAAIQLHVGAPAEALLFDETPDVIAAPAPPAATAPDRAATSTARGGAPAISFDKTTIELDCPSLPTNVERAAPATSAGHGAPIGPLAPPAAAAPRTLARLVTVEAPDTLRARDETTAIALLDRGALAALYDDPRPTIVRGLPLADGSTADFLLEPFEVFSPDARIVAFDGVTETLLPPPPVRLYHGGAIGDNARDVVVTITEGTELRMLAREQGQEVLSVVPRADADPDAATGRAGVPHVAILGTTSPGDVFCGMEDVPENRALLDAFDEAAARAAADATARAEVCFDSARETEVLVDINFALYAGTFGASTSRATTYAANLFGAASAVYQRDINNYLTIKHLFIWTTSDPFGAASSSGQLSAYRSYNQANRAGVARDVAHLLAHTVDYGGIAFLSALCSSTNGYAVSNIFGNVNFAQSGYTWDVSVVAHELGHNFGSPHTHCYSPPIDCCYNQQCACGPAVPQVGTIMSYCHLNGSVAMNFHPRVIDVMRAFSQSRACILDYEGVPERRVRISNTGTAALTVDDVTLDEPTPWLAMCPAPPFTIAPGASLNLHVDIACPDVPSGTTVRTITVHSDAPAGTSDLTVIIHKKARIPLERLVSPEGTGSISASPAPDTDGRWEEGATVNLTAFPAVGWQFESWQGDASGTQSFTSLAMDEPRSVTAVFVPRRYSITVVVDPPGSGTVTYDPEPDGDGTWPANEEVTVTAVGNPGFAFVAWEPGTAENPLVTVLNSNKVVAAKFKAGYRLTIGRNPPAGGLVRTNPVSSDNIFTPGQNVSLTAQLTPGYAFGSWGGDASGTTIVTSVTMNADRSVMANFIPPKDTLTVAASPEEGGTVALDPLPDELGRYDRGTVVTLTATPAVGYGFLGWSGAATSADTTIEYTVTGAATITANFAPLRNELTVAVVPIDGGTIMLSPDPDPDGFYDLGVGVEMTAVAADGFTFLGWEGDATGTQPTTELTMNGPRSVTARFQPPQYGVALLVTPEGGGAILASPPPGPGGLYDRDTVVTLTAQPAGGFVFAAWGDDAAGETGPVIQLTVTGALTVSAQFAAQSSVIVR